MEADKEIDDSLYSRQRYVLGDAAMKSMASSSVFLSGLSGLGVEIAKNVVLGGVKRCTLHDTQHVTSLDLGAQFYFSPEDVGRNRAEVSLPKVAELNPYVDIDSSSLDLDSGDLAPLAAYRCVILADCALSTQLRVNAYCREHGVRFISSEIHGVFGWSFVDFGEQFEVLDGDGETVQEIPIGRIAPQSAGEGAASDSYEVHTLDEETHDLADGDVVSFSELSGDYAALNGQEVRIKVLKSDRFSFEAPDGVQLASSALEKNGAFIKVKQRQLVDHTSLARSLEKPRIISSDFTKIGALGSLMAGYRALHAFKAEHEGAAPRPWNEEDAAAVLSKAKTYLPLSYDDTLFGGGTTEELDEGLVKSLSFTSAGCMPPLCAFFGGVVGQECLKGLTGKFTPQHGWLVLDTTEILASKSPEWDGAAFRLKGDRSDALRICVGDFTCDTLSRLKLFMIGVGAIGCELLKNFAMLGVATAEDGAIHTTDPDIIEKSNLNRQFLFRPKDIQSPKSTTAAQAVKQMNPAIRVEAALDKVCKETEKKYSDKFFQSLDIVVNALDNVAARRYVDGRCVENQRPLLESGTMGTKGHVQVIVPHKTSSYTDQRDPPGKDIPFCTLKSFPSKIEHCIEWSKDLAFEKQFAQKPAEFNKVLKEENLVESLLEHPQGPQFTKTLRRVLKVLRARPASFEDCVRVARLKFEHYYANAPKQLLFLFPLDHKVKDGKEMVPFWTPPKKPPKPIEFDASNQQHIDFITAYANLHAWMWSLPEQRDEQKIKAIVAEVEVPVFVPKKNKKVETDPSKLHKKGDAEDQDDDEQGDDGAQQVGDGPQIQADSGGNDNQEQETDREKFEEVLRELGGELDKLDRSKSQMRVADFEKDDDSNFHIDFITAASNLRGAVYGIKPADRLETKRIAGRIIPAIATTTSAVSAWVSVELVKLALQVGVEEHKNLTTNLALPFYLFSEPDPPITKKLGDMTYSKWDSWDVRLGLDVPVKQVLEYFNERYGLAVISIVQGQVMVYMEDLPGCDDVEDIMRDILEVPSGAKFVSLVVTFKGKDEEVLSGPAVRYWVKASGRKKRKKGAK